MKRVSIYLKLAIAFIVSLILAFFIKKDSIPEFIKIVLSAASFLFGIIVAFSIANRHARLSEIRSSLREQDAVILNIFELSKVFGKKIIEGVKKRFDELLIAQTDYKLIDYFKESPGKLEALYIFIEKIKAKTKIQEKAQEKALDSLSELEKIQKRVEYQVRNGMMLYEWISLYILAGMIFFCLFYINSGSIMSILIVSLLSAVLVLLLLVLSELDSLRWQEKNWIWQPLSELFIELGLIPYFPEALFKEERLKIKHFEHLKKVRIASYPNPYPDMKGKTVKTVKL